MLCGDFGVIIQSYALASSVRIKQGAEMKLITLFATCLLLVIGLVIQNRYITIAGGVLFLVGEVGHLILTYRAAKFCRAGQDHKWCRERTKSQKLVDGMWNWLVIVGLILWGVGSASNNEAMAISGAMLWIGRIVNHLIAGFILQNVAGIPLRMTYDGWKVGRPQRRRRR